SPPLPSLVRHTQKHAVDQQRAARPPPRLSDRRISTSPSREAAELRPRSRGRDVGAVAVSRRVWSAAAAAVIGVQVGSAMVATRFVVDQTGPASLAYGLRSIPSARAALIFATFPLLTSLVATAL